MKKARLGDLVEIKGGGTPDKSRSEFWNGNIPWASVKDFKSTEICSTVDSITELGVANSATNIIPAGSILVPTRMAVGKAAVNAVAMAINQDLKALTLGAKVDTRYLLHALLANASVLERQATGATVKGITLEVLRGLEILLPPLDEQRRIAGILDQADALRQQRKTSSVQLNRLLRSSFVYLFGDPISNSRGWVLDKLGNVGELERGVSKHRPRNDPVLLNGVYPLVQTGDIANADGYVTSYRSTYSELGLKQSRLWPKGTLCITIAANIGDAAILTFDACFPDSIVGFVPSRSVTSSYIQYLFSFLKQKLEDDAPSFAQKNINLSILRDISVPVPPLDAQNKFENIVEAIHREREKQNSFFDGIEVLFSSLQHRAFNGQL